MKTMGLEDLVLVAPQRYPSAEATAMASGADDLLSRARVVEDLEAALTGAHRVVGTSARLRSLSWPTRDARGSAEAVVAELTADAAAEVALVFGRERTGLSNREMDRCHWLLHVPTASEYASLNLAMAVQLVAYELRMAQRAAESAPPVAARPEESPAAPWEELERMFEHLEVVLERIGFLDPANPRHLMRRLRRLLLRAEPDRNEVNILRGILAAIQKEVPETDDERRATDDR